MWFPRGGGMMDSQSSLLSPLDLPTLPGVYQVWSVVVSDGTFRDEAGGTGRHNDAWSVREARSLSDARKTSSGAIHVTELLEAN